MKHRIDDDSVSSMYHKSSLKISVLEQAFPTLLFYWIMRRYNKTLLRHVARGKKEIKKVSGRYACEKCGKGFKKRGLSLHYTRAHVKNWSTRKI